MKVSGYLQIHLGKLGRDVKQVVIRGCKPMIHIMYLQARLVSVSNGDLLTVYRLVF